MRAFSCPLLLASLLAALPLVAADAPPAPDAKDAATRAAELAKTLKYQEGTIVLGDGLAKVALQDGYHYLSPADAETVLVKFWGNPGGRDTLGMIVPAGFDPLGTDNWAAVLSFADDGYVKDDDAAKINYADLLKEMQEGMAEANKQRAERGYEPITLVGWATPPRYDAAAHKLHWAKELKFGSEKDNTLNYNIRMLGRRGVLVVNAVASMDRLKDVETATPALLTMVNFQEGHRYADFNDSTDKVATYGLAALVAGGVAAKAGFFKMLWIGILAFKKVIIIGVIALASQARKIIDWIRGRNAHATAVAGTPPADPPTTSA